LAQLAHSSVDTVTPDRIMSPPMVGVPFLAKCVAGPSSRMGCPCPA
jgi:hypothetical protein